MLLPRIKELRLERGLTQKQVAEALGCTLPYYAARECGRTMIRMNFLVCLAKFYGVSCDYLAGLTDERDRC